MTYENLKSKTPTIFIIFGATGDLTKRKLVPALFRLHQKNLLPELFQTVGFSRQGLNSKDFQKRIKDIVNGMDEKNPGEVDSFVKLFSYIPGSFDNKDGYRALASFLGMEDKKWRVCSNKLFYLAVPPHYYKEIFKNLSASGLTKPCGPEEGWTRVVVEKPFGKDLKTAEELDALLGELFKEEQIYRIDHYLGKETVQNILAFRFSNSFLGPAWSENSIESISAKFFEKAGVEGRGEFYDGVGALRDIGQNHLLQLIALMTMENPVVFDAASVRNGRTEILRSLKILAAGDIAKSTVTAQYQGYLNEKEVSPQSTTETYFKIKFFLDTPRWKNAPIYIEGGKKLNEDKVEISLIFKHPTPCLCPPGVHYKNILRYQIQPREGISISFWVKKPGFAMEIEEKDFSFDYEVTYGKEKLSDPHIGPYQKLLLDAIVGNQTLFVSTEEIMASWKFIDPIIRAWEKNITPLIVYKPGSSSEDIARLTEKKLETA